uniref:Php n=1 Tax=Trichoplusia ni single nucleopolyhedrovirus TaxID=332054 RepID=A0A481VAC5_9ABAC|nr:php [Trichoplusia ni single nucleopolyhedrovirus]
MSYLLSLGGVACTTKTTILKQIVQEKIPNVVVHFDDYKELHDRYGFNHRMGSELFAAYRNANDIGFKRDYMNVHIFDRQPMESLVYSSIRQKINKTTSYYMYVNSVDMGLHDGWKSVILRTHPSNDELFVDMMKKRDNKIDTYNVGYIREQNNRFNLWSKAANATELYVNLKNNNINHLTREQSNIKRYILNQIYNVKCYDGLVVYTFRLPIIQEKIAFFSYDYLLWNLLSFTPDRRYRFIIEKMIRLLDQKFTLVFMCHLKFFDINEHINYLCKTINLPLVMMIATGDNQYCIPRSGCVDYLTTLNPNVDWRQSRFYGQLKDDREKDFARNNNIQYFDRLNFFLNK